MKKIAMLSAVMFCVSAAKASELRNLSLNEIKASKLELPLPSAPENGAVKCGHVTGDITKLHLLAQTAKSLLFTSADTAALFKEFTDMWKPILEKFGLKPTTTEYTGHFGTLNYESSNGLVVRDFFAERLHYDALSVTAMETLKHELLEPLERAGMTPVASFNIKNEIFRPTFNIYYLTKPDANPSHEIKLRHLMRGDDIDFDILQNAGITLVKKDTSFSLVYIGKEVGFVSKVGVSEEAVNKKVSDYKKYLTENKLEFIGSRTFKLDETFIVGSSTLTHGANIYFYQ
ncbi:MAG TPA: hypothetical protein DCL44_11755 [Elusimicrobia bacterium]|nr:hypothetical protein [Elusimicrobiota bacterium]